MQLLPNVSTINLNQVPFIVDNNSMGNTQEQDPLSLEEVSPLDVNILKLLGNENSSSEILGDDLHHDLAVRWESILKSGLTEEVKNEIIKKYPPSKNCILMAAPKLNSEVKAAVTETVRARDEKLAKIQTQVGAGLSALGRALNFLFEEKEGGEAHNMKLIEIISDSARLLADIHHQDSQTRRNLIGIYLKKDVASTLTDAVVDGWLFGENLGERVKTARAIEQSGKDLKVAVAGSSKHRSSFHKNRSSLNSKPSRYVSARGRLGGQKNPPRNRGSNKYYAEQRQVPRTSRVQSSRIFR